LYIRNKFVIRRGTLREAHMFKKFMPLFDKKDENKDEKILELNGNIVLSSRNFENRNSDSPSDVHRRRLDQIGKETETTQPPKNLGAARREIVPSEARPIWQNEKGIQISETPAKIVLDKENFSIFPEKWGTYIFSYREVIDLIPEDYRLKLSLGKGQELQISQLGYQYEDFVRIFIKLRNEILLKDLLFQETLKKSGFEADFVYLDKTGLEKQKGKAEFRFYQTSLVILPEKGELLRIRFSDILETKTDDFQIVIADEAGQKFIISKLGEKFDLFKETLQSCLNEISLNIQNFIKGIWPEIDFSTLNKISGLIKEGKAVSKKDIEGVSPEFFKKLEMALMRTEVKEEYEFLKSIGEQDKIYIGFKKGLMGGLTGDYFWFFIPIYPVRDKPLQAAAAVPKAERISNGVYSEDKSKPGNAIAFETAGEKEKGRATYFFRIVSRKEYAKMKDREEMGRQTDDLILKINRALGAINFRREPIYLSEEKLEEPKYVRYKFSMAKIPEIKLMRELFIGRVIHSDNKQWQEDVKNLLVFNLNSKDDKEKWQKTEKTAESEIGPPQENEMTEESERGGEVKENESGGETIE